jgi:hypothetical protein
MLALLSSFPAVPASVAEMSDENYRILSEVMMSE